MVYWPTVIASLVCGLVATSIGFVLTLQWAFSGVCESDCADAHAASGWGFALEMAGLTAGWLVAVLLIVYDRPGPTPKKARVIGVLAAAAIFNTLVWAVVFGSGGGGISILLVPLVIAPLIAAFAGGFITCVVAAPAPSSSDT